MDSKLLGRSATGCRLYNLRLDRVDSSSISLGQLFAAVHAVPGARLGVSAPDSAGNLHFAVEVYDPDLEAWQAVITLARGLALIEYDDIEDRQGAAYRAVVQLTRLLDSYLVTAEGEVLVWDWQAAA